MDDICRLLRAQAFTDIFYLLVSITLEQILTTLILAALSCYLRKYLLLVSLLLTFFSLSHTHLPIMTEKDIPPKEGLAHDEYITQTVAATEAEHPTKPETASALNIVENPLKVSAARESALRAPSQRGGCAISIVRIYI